MSTPLEAVTTELTNLAQAILQVDLERIWPETVGEASIEDTGFCILAFGKLGGGELNYSSDIDLLATFAESAADESFAASAGKVVERLRGDLSTHALEGYVYRVDLRLRPFGTSGPLVQSTAALERYYRSSAAAWELQALLKLRPVAGHLATGNGFLERIWPTIAVHRTHEEVSDAIDHLRELAMSSKQQRTRRGTDVKSGRGGIRDIEFLLQGLQMIHLHDLPSIRTGNTLEGLAALVHAGILPGDEYGFLIDDYRFLRRLEHLLQVYDDRQTHVLPDDPAARHAIARRMGMQTELFNSEVVERMLRVRSQYERHLLRIDLDDGGSSG
jgi:glutamate-ammonia-ligase adenylyltransferase